MKPEEYERFADLILLVSNGTATDEERVFVDNFLSQNPQYRREMEFLEMMRDVICEDAIQLESDQTFKEFVRRLEAMPLRPSSTPSEPAFGERLRAWLQDWSLTPAFAVAATLVVVQASFLATRQAEEPGISYRGEVPQAAPEVLALRITFKPDVPFAELMDVLRSERATLVSGPDESGAVVVRLPADAKPADVAARISAAGITDDVVVVR